MTFGLTPKQIEVLKFVQIRAASGKTPTLVEIAKGVGLKSKSGVSRIMDQLEDRGHITRLPGRARAIEVLGDGPVFLDRDTRLASLSYIEGTKMRMVELISMAVREYIDRHPRKDS